jgi:hypothetical protein
MLRPKYLIIAGSAFCAEQIKKVYDKNKLCASFDIDVAFSCYNVVKPNKNWIIIDSCRREIVDRIPRYRWYMPKGAKVEVDTQYGMVWEARETLLRLACNKYDAVINACRPGDEGDAEFWYILDEVEMRPNNVIRLPMDGLWDEKILGMLLLTLNNN